MELKDFISASMEGIADGIIEANLKLSGKGFIVSPSAHRINDRLETPIPLVQNIEFNLLVEESSGANIDNKLSIKVLSGGVNTKIEGKQSSTLSFRIPVVYPQFHFLLSEIKIEEFQKQD